MDTIVTIIAIIAMAIHPSSVQVQCLIQVKSTTIITIIGGMGIVAVRHITHIIIAIKCNEYILLTRASRRGESLAMKSFDMTNRASHVTLAQETQYDGDE